jgi:hypothetical protein
VQFFILSQSGERWSLNRGGQGRPYPKTDRKEDTLGAINLGQRGYRRMGHSHLQGARKGQADHDDGAGQHTDRDQSAFAVASHNKRAHPLIERRTPPTKGQSTQSPEGRKEEFNSPSQYPSSPKWGRGATGVSFKRPLKLALATKDLPLQRFFLRVRARICPWDCDGCGQVGRSLGWPGCRSGGLGADVVGSLAPWRRRHGSHADDSSSRSHAAPASMRAPQACSSNGSTKRPQSARY